MFFSRTCLSKTMIIPDMIDFINTISCSETRHVSTKQRLAVIFAIFCVFCSKDYPWVIEFQENQLIILIYIITTCTIMPIFINLGKIFDTRRIWKRRVE